jgi:hypothetical protein
MQVAFADKTHGSHSLAMKPVEYHTYAHTAPNRMSVMKRNVDKEG